MTVDHYRQLGVTSTASHAEIRVAYRRLAQRLHPDTHGGVVSAEMVAVNEAWRVLSDQGRRSTYDAKLRNDAAYAAPATGAQWSAIDDDDDYESDYDRADYETDDYDDDGVLIPMAETVALRRWMVLITFTMIAAGLLLAALFVYAFIRSGSTAR
jgi:curved DNA-binding protein CbpA